MPQSYSSHAHHPRATYLAAVFTLVAIICLTGDWLFGWNTGKPGAVALSLAVAALAGISRWYITPLQNRIIRLEMEVRLRQLLPESQQAQIAKLAMAQFVGLRFASDAELPALVERAVNERLSRDDIKRAITDWQGDYYRT